MSPHIKGTIMQKSEIFMMIIGFIVIFGGCVLGAIVELFPLYLIYKLFEFGGVL